MNNKSSILKALIALIIIICVGVYLWKWYEKPLIGKPVPDFQLTTLEGQPIDQSIFSGHITFLIVWSSQCTACEAQVVSFQKLIDATKGVGIPIPIQAYGLDTEPSVDVELDAQKTLDPNPLVATISDPDQVLFKSLNLSHYDGSPIFLMIDPSGIIRRVVVMDSNGEVVNDWKEKS